MDIQIDIRERERVDQSSFTKRIRYENEERGGEGGKGSNRRMVELNARVKKRINAIYHASIPPPQVWHALGIN